MAFSSRELAASQNADITALRALTALAVVSIGVGFPAGTM
jgi:hypothetical protein